MQESARERLRKTGDDVLIAPAQMPEFRERTVEMPPAHIVGTGVKRRDHGRGLARHALPDEKRGGQAAGFFALGDDLGRNGHLGPQIVHGPVPQAVKRTCIRCDAPRHGDVDDDEIAPLDPRSEEIRCEDRTARVGRRYDAVGVLQRLGDVLERDGLTIGGRRRLLRALTRPADDEDASDPAAKRT